MTDPIPDAVLALLRAMSEMTTTTPTVREVVASCEVAGIGQDDALDRLEAAIGLGLVDPADDCGPETLFCLSTLATEHLGIEPTFDSRRWQTVKGRHLLGPHDPDGRYRRRKPAPADDDEIMLHHRVDARQMRPDQIVIAVEAEKRRFDGEKPENAPMIHRFYGLGVIWEGEEEIVGTCPYCKGETLGLHAYCLKCHNAGMNRFLTKPAKSSRRQMPRSSSPLKGGV